MPKLKTHSGAKKRFKLTKSGKVKRAHAYKSHILTKKSTKVKRRLRMGGYADKTNADAARYAAIGRKQKPRDFRKLWITRISAAAKMNGMNYSTFIYGLNKAGVALNRKMLSEIAVSDAAAFTALVEKAKAAL